MKKYVTPRIKIVEIANESLLDNSPSFMNEVGDTSRSFLSNDRDSYDMEDEDCLW